MGVTASWEIKERSGWSMNRDSCSRWIDLTKNRVDTDRDTKVTEKPS